MKRCSRCLTPDTRPGTIFKEGVCQACINYEKRKKIDWEARFQELVSLIDSHRFHYYDCAIAVSGGKDSHFLTYLVKAKLKMNPLLIRIGDGFGISEAGKHNIQNLKNAFGCDLLEWSLKDSLYRQMVRRAFEELGNFPVVDFLIYFAPIKIAHLLGIELVFFGEDPAYEYGTSEEEHKTVDLTAFSPVLEWMRKNFGGKETAFFDTLEFPDVTHIYTSYYVPWSGHQNYLLAQQYGFKDLTDFTDNRGQIWRRKGSPAFYDSLDMLGWQVSHWLKWGKFGFGRATDIYSRWLRERQPLCQDRDIALKLVKSEDGQLDPIILADFLRYTGYTEKQFWAIAKRFVNRSLFENPDDLPNLRLAEETVGGK